MKVSKIFSKLKSEKGATGVDIVVSISVIAVTIAVVIAIYTNVDLTSKRVQRTAGATRIATSIVEQIEKMYYEDFLSKINDMKEYSPDSDEKFVISSKNVSGDVRIFNTKIPKGYTVEISLENDYGKDSDEYKFDMVKKVNIEVKFPVGNLEESVKLSTAKATEIVKLGNQPEVLIEEETTTMKIKTLDGTEIINVEPVKIDGSRYVTTTTADEEWYNYETAIWAKVIVNYTGDKKDINMETEENLDNLYVWIPSFGKDKEGNLRFRYGDTRYGVTSKTLDSVESVDGVKKAVFTVDSIELTDFSDSLDFKDKDGNNVRGCWVKYNDIYKDEYAKTLNNSEYGALNL